MQRCQHCGAPMPLGYCTRPACSEAGQTEDKLHAALAELAETLEVDPPDAGDHPGRDGTAAIDLQAMFAGASGSGDRFCPSCAAPVGGERQVCVHCGNLLPQDGLATSGLRLSLQRSVAGFPGQFVSLPTNRCRLGLNQEGLAVVTRAGQRSVVELEPLPGDALSVTDFDGFGVHVPIDTPARINDGQTLRIGQQILLVGRSPKGSFPRAGAGSRGDVETRLAAPALRRAPWYLHRLLPNGSVGALIPLAGNKSVGDKSCDIDLGDPLVQGTAGTFQAGDDLTLIPDQPGVIWLRARQGDHLGLGGEIWIGDAIYRLERRHG